MAHARPFRGIRYDPTQIESLDLVVSPPYDVIDTNLRERLYRRSAHNIVRVDYGVDRPEDHARENRYTRGARTLGEWLRSGVLRQDVEASLYYLEEEYTGERGVRKTRNGVVAAVRLEDAGSALYRPHEKTLAGPRADRLQLTRACRANLSSIFSLYDDPGSAVLKGVEEHARTRSPAGAARDEDGGVTRLWQVSDPTVIEGVVAGLEGKSFFIADGHHRYETALAYRDEMRRESPGHRGTEPWNYVMMYLSNLWGDGLTVLPTHRAVFGLETFDTDRFLGAAAEYFVIEEFPVLETLQTQMIARRGGGRHLFGVALPGGRGLRLLSLKEEVSLARVFGGRVAPALQYLDVTVLHSLILDRILGVDDCAQEQQRNLRYVKRVEDLVQQVSVGSAQLGFVLNPTRIEQVKAVAKAGERMPQKSTFFYPKLITGLVLNPLGDPTEIGAP